MRTRWTLLSCLVFSGTSALVYQVLWTRLLGFVFGTTHQAIGTVLAVFFTGMALGNLVAARRLARVERPLRLYGLLELGIGLYALITLPVLRQLVDIYAWLGADAGPGTLTALRIAACALVLLPPTIAMGATLPVVARGLVLRSATLGRWSAYLYTANTLGAVLGAYLCGFWLIPALGLTHTLLAAVAVNVAVAVVVMGVAWDWRVAASSDEQAEAGPAPGAHDPQERGWFLVFFAVSGFVAIGYEIVWSKVFTIVMEGTLYGFSTVLSAYLLGLAIGSLVISGVVDRLRDLPRVFGLLHVAIAASVALGILVVGDLPYWHQRIAEADAGTAGIHGLYLLAAPIVLLPTVLFGAAFPLLIRIYTSRAGQAGQGIGMATAVNTTGSIVASLLIGFWLIPAAGIDATLYGLVLIELAIGLLVLLRFQTSEGRERLLATGAAALVLAFVVLGYDGVRVERAVAGRWVKAKTLPDYRARLARRDATTALVIEGRSSVVTVHASASGWVLKTNGLPEAGYDYGPPYRSFETLLLGMLPYFSAATPSRALVVGFGGGATVDALLRTPLGKIEVVELEEGVITASHLLYRGRSNPLDDPRVELRINDGRNELLLSRERGGPGFDIVSSQPSHPWLIGAANLFTEDYFALVRDSLSPGGAFALWVNGFHTQPESLLAILTSFERVLPGGLLFTSGGANPHVSYMLVGAREPLRWSAERLSRRFADPAVREAFAIQGVSSVEELIARCEGPIAAFAAIAPDAANTDDNAFVEMRLSRRLDWTNLDFSEIETRLPADAPVLPSIEGEIDVAQVARAMLAAPLRSDGVHPYLAKLARLLRAHGHQIEEVERIVLEQEIELRGDGWSAAADALAALADEHPDRPEPLRTLARFWALQKRDYPRAAPLYEAAWQRSREATDAYGAARAWHRLDPAKAALWTGRIPAAERERFPRLALYEAQDALEAGSTDDSLEQHFAALERYRDTTEGRPFPDVDETLSRLAAALGNERAARAYADADRTGRRERGKLHMARAQRALHEGRLDEAAALLREAGTWIPVDPERLRLMARVAAARGDSAALETALSELRHWAPTLPSGIASENRLRAELELPLLPERPAELLIAEP